MKIQLLAVLIVVGVAGAVTLASSISADQPTQSHDASSSADTSAWVRINSGDKQPISKGDIFYFTRLPNGACDTPSFSTGMLGDVARVESYIDEGECALVIQDVVLNPRASMFD